jgi:hypothetical protein
MLNAEPSMPHIPMVQQPASMNPIALMLGQVVSTGGGGSPHVVP